MNLPDLPDFSPSNLTILDERTAFEHFHGKTLRDAVSLFHEAEHVYVDDLVWMGAPAFDYYLDAYITYIKEAKAGQPDICLAMHVVVTRTLLDRATKKMSRLVDTIEIYRKDADACDKQLEEEYAKVIAERGRQEKK